MPGRGDITAGRAFVELFVKQGAFTKGLADAGAKLRAFGNGLKTIGTGMLGVGAAITAPFVAALHHFESTGSALNDMAARTGASVEALAQLGYAADQTGASIEDVEKSIVKMQKSIMSARDGSKEMQQTFTDLGLSLSALAALPPDEQFKTVAAAIADIEDPTVRAAMAMQVFGKSATSLLPMIANLAALTKEAEELGAMTTEEAAAADELGDALGRLKAIAGNTASIIGSALAPTITELLDGTLEIAKQVMAWARDNKELAKTIALVGIALMGAGMLFHVNATSIATVITVIGVAFGAFTSFIGVLGLVANPAVLLVGALVGIAVGLYKSGAAAKEFGALFAWVGSQMGEFSTYAAGLFGELSADFAGAWKGIVDAVSGGDLRLAGEVAMAGLMVVWLRGTQGINKLWAEAKWFFLTVWTEATAGLAKLFSSAWAGMKSGWIEVAAFLESSWNSLWAKLAKPLGAFILMIADAALAFDQITAQQHAVIKAGIVAGVGDAIGGKDAREKAIQDKKKADLGKVDADKATALNAIDQDKATEQGQINAAFDKQLADRQAALDAAKDELKLKQDAAAGVAEGARMLKGDVDKPEPPGSEFGGEKAVKTAGSFSAASLFALGGGAGGPDKIAKDQLGAALRLEAGQQKLIEMERAKAMEAFA